jgi:hypothetical protein
MKIHSLEIGKLRSKEHFQFITDMPELAKDIPAEPTAGKIAQSCANLPNLYSFNENFK